MNESQRKEENTGQVCVTWTTWPPDRHLNTSWSCDIIRTFTFTPQRELSSSCSNDSPTIWVFGILLIVRHLVINWAKTFILWGRTSLIRVESSNICRWFDFFQTQIWRLVPLRLLCSGDVRLLTTCTFKCVFSVKVTLICVYVMLSWCV